MAKVPKKPEEIFTEITEDYQQIFGVHLLSIVLYGSGAGEDYIPGKSDLNFLITLTDQGVERLDRALEMVARWRKRNVAIPLFMTRSDLQGSQDSYPIEFLNMKRHYIVVFGADVLAEFTFDQCHIRLQLERELRGKLLHLRSGYLATRGNTRKIRELITLSLTAFISLFSALLYLKNIEIPHGKREVITAAGQAFGIDASLFLKCEEIRRKTDRLSSIEVRAVFQSYMKEVSRLCDQIDRMEV
ncbi:MAG: hypothetical protein C0390_13270 [Syntrophus sp. (in: bacteria)]|nr:hypothetical protein [Syntrophus sp. (in: bacteria)]